MELLRGYPSEVPFEVATPAEVFEFYRKRGVLLVKLKTCREGLGNNEFVFEKAAQ